ncbi:MAG: hypothetical protein ACREXP_24455 [Steroidobacteraceae bacterium]
MSDSDLIYELFRCTVHGGSKDWGILVTADHDLRTVHCATGQTVRHTHIPKSKFSDVWVEKHRRVKEKTAKGYEFLGRAMVESNRLTLLPPLSGDAREGVHRWEIFSPVDRTLMHERLVWAEAQLSGHVAPDSIEYDAPSIVCRCTGPEPWVFGFTDEGGLQKTGRGGGVIVRDQGLLPRLLLLYLMRCFPDVMGVTDSLDRQHQPRIARDSDFVGEQLFDYERVLELGSRLGLCVGPIQLLDWQDGGSHVAFWI